MTRSKALFDRNRKLRQNTLLPLLPICEAHSSKATKTGGRKSGEKEDLPGMRAGVHSTTGNQQERQQNGNLPGMRNTGGIKGGMYRRKDGCSNHAGNKRGAAIAGQESYKKYLKQLKEKKESI